MIRIAIVVLSLVLSATAVGCQDARFDKDSWVAAKGDSSRQAMVKLLESALKVGMSAEEVVELMGEPSTKIDSKGKKSHIYDLGRGLIDYEEFHVIFDDDWKVKKFMQVQG